MSYMGNTIDKPAPAYQGDNGYYYSAQHSHQGTYTPAGAYYPGPQQQQGYSVPNTQYQPQPPPQMVFVQSPQAEPDSSAWLPCACLTGCCAALFCCPCWICI